MSPDRAEHVVPAAASMLSGLSYPWAEPPAPARAVPVSPGVRWLRMPLPFQLDHINLWLLEDDGGWAVVDTGVGLERTRELWEQVFTGELDGGRVTRVVITHFHPDHMGNAEWLAARWGVDVWCAQAEWLTAQLAWRGAGGNDPEKRVAHYRRAGVSAESLARFRERGNHYRQLVPTVPAQFRCLREGESLVIGGHTWQVLTVRGHAPEHACLHCPEIATLISGDQVLPKITTNVSVWPDQPLGNPLRLYLESLQRFRPMAPNTLVLPSHGMPFRGLHARLDQLGVHHETRLAEVLDALTEPRSGIELVPVLFRRQLDIHQLGFAIGETLAHLHLLESLGRIVRLTGNDGVHRFRKA
jgi:glyoxylase-like metal-dependent hydrolase (beta-lactamase superfamily II)